MPPYATSGTGNMTLNTALPAALYPGDELWMFGLSFVAANGPTPGQIQAANDSNVLFETVAVGQRSIAAAMAPRPGGGSPAGASVLVWANGNPGAMEVDVQLSPMDADGHYQTPTGTAYKITTWNGPSGPNGQYSAWLEFQPLGDNFVSLKVISNPNTVKIAAKLSYN